MSLPSPEWSEDFWNVPVFWKMRRGMYFGQGGIEDDMDGCYVRFNESHSPMTMLNPGQVKYAHFEARIVLKRATEKR